MLYPWQNTYGRATILTGVPILTIQGWLTDAQAAYAALLSGGKVVNVSYEGKSVSYTQADMTNLTQWIGMLQRQLGLAGPRRAMTPYFTRR